MKRDFQCLRAYEQHLRAAGVPRSLAVQFTGMIPDHVIRNLLPMRLRFALALRGLMGRIGLSDRQTATDATTQESTAARGRGRTEEASSGVSPAGRESKQERRSHAPSVRKARPSIRN
ncbi:hypothetical protein I5S84_23800 [Pseudomonas putida]|uniref:hypothetical protein n=1 Tax=Pseudomonas putida TaxID=303 RepID=UPI0018D5BDC4|nr:hypothetical protein [Pseudomonas putida]MBH3451853.1 hypothetical protein [Pseudomonas putida]